MISRRHLSIATLAALILGLAQLSPAQDKIKALIVDGQNGHNWKATTPVIKELLEKTGRFTVDVATSPARKAPREEWDKFKPEFTKYGVVVDNYQGDPWPDAVKKSLEDYVSNGGGLVVYHFAVAAFPEWDNFNKMIGLGWKKNTFGDRWYMDDAGKWIRVAKGEGQGNGHGPAHVFEVTIRDAEHPITKGLPAKWTHASDELYHGQRGPGENMHFLATSFSAKDKGGTGCHEPMAWTIPFGKGRVFTTLLGHDVPQTVHLGAATLLVRGAEWAATEKVTIPAPSEIPAPSK